MTEQRNLVQSIVELEEEVRRLKKKVELVEWFEKHCDWGERTDHKQKGWTILVVTSSNTTVQFGDKTFLGAIETARSICE